MSEGFSRYDRQMRFRAIGEAGQVRLAAARVAIVGAGALGSHSASWLARAGVGFLRMIDRDLVDRSNLQRQILYTEADADGVTSKAEAAAARLKQMNSEIEYDAVTADLNWMNAENLLSDVDLIIDGTDNMTARRVINDISVKCGIPWSYGGAVSSYGSVAFFVPGETPCLNCLYPETSRDDVPDTCDTVGVIAPAIALVAALQTADVLKWLVGDTESITYGMKHIDAWAATFDTMAFSAPNPTCSCCTGREFRYLEPNVNALTIRLCGRDTIQISSAVNRGADVPFDKIAASLRDRPHVRYNSNLLQWRIEGCVLTLFKDGRVLVQGTADQAEALRLFRQLPMR